MPRHRARSVSRRRYRSVEASAERRVSPRTSPSPAPPRASPGGSKTTNPLRLSESAAARTVASDGAPATRSGSETRTRNGGYAETRAASSSSSSSRELFFFENRVRFFRNAGQTLVGSDLELGEVVQEITHRAAASDPPRSARRRRLPRRRDSGRTRLRERRRARWKKKKRRAGSGTRREEAACFGTATSSLLRLRRRRRRPVFRRVAGHQHVSPRARDLRAVVLVLLRGQSRVSSTSSLSSDNTSASISGSQASSLQRRASVSIKPARRSPHATTSLPPGLRCAAAASGSASQCSGK